jgi:hypothetical protein
MAGSVVTLNELLGEHVGLSIECLDRIYLNGYVPNLQVGGQVVTFLTKHLGKPIPSPAVFEQIGARSAVRSPRSPRPARSPSSGSTRATARSR